ncbi:phenylacetate--CoA ligase family protein [Thalassotalea euphylliae]|uniref:Phenylacetate--CoA ligase family protein n=1 Tax=Thalassotalea euphylliae TaxID=1655234 RepID=A0A3E0U2Z6_9GAMM|nr:AMP-binding protein [Thalassotalea euphylliae]REL31306.1 phenylacetate--CoA ligase family protein [Thalassotalea euphylliae]
MYSIFKKDLFEKAEYVYQEHSKFDQGKIALGELYSHQESRLQAVLKYVISGSSFYQNHLSVLTPKDIDSFSLKDIQRLPFTTKEDLRAQGSAMLSTPLADSWIYYETTGTTGKPTPCPRNELDSIYNNTPLIINYRKIFEKHGSKHIVGVMGPTELHSTGDTFEDVLRSLGHSVVKMWPRSPVVGMKRVMNLIQELKITALVCTPAVAIGLARFMREHDLSPAKSSVKLILTLGELTTPELLRNIGEIWDAKLYNCMYASQESSILAVGTDDNYLYTVPYNNFYEVVDPETGNTIESNKRAVTGELVITHLYKGQKPLIRYRTGDMVNATPMPNGQLKIVPIGRVKDRLLLNGITYSAWQLESTILKKLHNCLDYAVQIDSHLGFDCLHITVELAKALIDQHEQLEDAKNYIESQLKNVSVHLEVGTTTNVTGTSAMVSWKAARLHDLRHESDNSDRNAALTLVSGGFK